jgi:hypothetical protein
MSGRVLVAPAHSPVSNEWARQVRPSGPGLAVFETREARP